MSEFLSLGLGKIREINQISFREKDREAPSNTLHELYSLMFLSIKAWPSFWVLGPTSFHGSQGETHPVKTVLGRKMSVTMSPIMLPYLPVMTDFISFRLTFMRPNDHLQLVFIKDLRGNIWSKIATPSSACIWITASFASGITPQKIDNLETTN